MEDLENRMQPVPFRERQPFLTDTVARTAAVEAFRTWRAIGEAQTDRSAENLVRLLWEPLRAKGSVFEAASAPGEVRLRCIRCPIAEMARTLGDREWLFHLASGIDEAVARGFNPAWPCAGPAP